MTASLGADWEEMRMTMLVKEAIGVNVKMTVLDCPNCGVLFAVSADLERRRRADHKGFYCPNGHSMSFGESDQERQHREAIERLEKRLEATNGAWDHERQNRKSAERSLSATKGVVTRMKNRAANGVCPCCNRYFANVHRHMKSQHPDFATAAEQIEGGQG